ncbi:MAG: hypothetical protein K2W96_23420 [Gemmataceae bacterium]|nr:hypothetical protein [Gemmataceae bacterium]
MIPLLLALAAAPPPPDPVVREVFAAWAKRRAALKSVRVRVSGTDAMPLDAAGAKTVDLPSSMDLLLDLAGQRHRVEEQRHYYSPNKPSVEQGPRRLSGFDGERGWGFLPDEKPPRASIAEGSRRWSSFGAEQGPLFLALGFVAGDWMNNQPGRFQPPLEERRFRFHRRETHEGRECVVLRTAGRTFHLPPNSGPVSFDEFWVDLGRGGLVLKRASHFGGRVSSTLELRYREEGGLWRPTGWTMAFLSQGDQPRLQRLSVESWQADPAFAADDFRMPLLPPGTKVGRRRYGDTGELAGNPVILSEEKLEVDEDGGLVPARPATTMKPNDRRWLVAGLVAALAVGVAWLRLRRRAPSPPTPQ